MPLRLPTLNPETAVVIITPSDSFTRPANTTAYAAGDLVANNATAASVTPLKFAVNPVGGKGRIRRVRLMKSDPTVTLASFIVHLFQADPGVPTNGDNGALAIASAADYLGEVTIDLATGSSPGTAYLWKASAAQDILFQLPSMNTRLYALIEATAGYTPASAEVFKVTLEIEGA